VARKKQKVWAESRRPPPLRDEAEKRAIIGDCEAFIRDVLKPRFLPEIRPTEWNYVVDIHGAWAGGRYRFMQRYRSGMEPGLFNATPAADMSPKCNRFGENCRR
jgi:hypothetical protein